MHADYWDIFASGHDAQSLWFGYQLAHGLVQRGYAARLFTDQLDVLAAAVADLDPTCWIQSHHGIEIADWRLAELCVVAPTAIQVLGTTIPAVYLARMEAGPTPTRCVEVVAHDADRDATTPLVMLEQRGSCTRMRAQFGDPPFKAGHIKSRPNATTLRKLWTKPAMREGLFQALGLRSDLADGKLSVFFDVRNKRYMLSLVEALATGPREVCVFMDKRPPDWASSHPEDRSTVMRHGAVTLVELPARRWFLTDELIWASDLVMTTEGDIAARACESGTPILWSSDDGAFFDWYVMKSPPVIRRTVSEMFDALATGADAKWAWTCYMTRWEEMRALSELVALRVKRAPDLIDVLIAALSGTSEEAMERQFSPTVPGEELV